MANQLETIMANFSDERENLQRAIEEETDAINRIIKMVNYPQFVLPDEMLTFKLYGKVLEN